MTTEALADQILQKIPQAQGLYHRLILVVGPAGCGKTKALQLAREHTGAALLNVNLELSRLLLDLTERQRALQIARLLSEIVNRDGSEVVLLDNTEILFDVLLKQDPLRLLQGSSRNRTLVATWNGSFKDAHVTYAAPGHPEYRRYPARDLLVASPLTTE